MGGILKGRLKMVEKKKKAAAAAKRKLLEILNKYNCILTKTWKERCTKVQSLDNIFFSCF